MEVSLRRRSLHSNEPQRVEPFIHETHETDGADETYGQ
jgi:hypothetical protein